jgi:hypothetical protein
MGNVLPGGSVTISGNILSEEVASIDVSGAGGILDYYPYQFGSSVGGAVPYQSLAIQSDGGSITFSGGEVLRVGSSLTARSGGNASDGGILTISSGLYHADSQSAMSSYQEDNLIIGNYSEIKPPGFTHSGFGALGVEVPWERDRGSSGGRIDAGVIGRSGADRLELQGNTRFDGDISLVAPGSIRVATGGILTLNGAVTLEAGHVMLGQAFRPPLSRDDTSLTSVMNWYSEATTDDVYVLPAASLLGSLTVKASQIDIGNLSVKGAKTTTLEPTGGTIRGNGYLDVAGDLLLNAAMLTSAPGTQFTLTAYDYLRGVDGGMWNAVSGRSDLSLVSGSITMRSDGRVSSPLSAAGAVAMYSSELDIDGTINVPFGSISVGWSGTGDTPVNPLSGSGFKLGSGISAPEAVEILLGSHAVLSVAGKDVITGKELAVNYGTSNDGASWIDPGGNIITTTGLPGKSVALNARRLVSQNGSLIDLSGGGSVAAYQFVSGLGGKNNLLSDATRDWSPASSYSPGDLVVRQGRTWSSTQRQSGIDPLSGTSSWVELAESYAILPGYASDYAPSGYGNEASLQPLKISFAGGGGLSPGTYTLLPASYASLPGAFLISRPIDDLLTSLPGVMPDGESLTYGTRFVSAGSASKISPLPSPWIITPPSLLRSLPVEGGFPVGKVEFNRPDAVTAFASTGTASPRNAGRGIFEASDMVLGGKVSGGASSSGRSALLDLSGPRNITIGVPGSVVSSGSLLDSGVINQWTFSSILIGGIRSEMDSGGTLISVSTSEIGLSEDTKLSGEEIILASSSTLVFGKNSGLISESGSVASENISVDGDGALVRVSAAEKAGITRFNRSDDSTAFLSLGEGVLLKGRSILVDSSGKAAIAPDSILRGVSDSQGSATAADINLNAGRIVLSFLEAPITDDSSLILSGRTLSTLQDASRLSLTSYSTIDLHGAASFGNPKLDLELHAGQIRGYDLNGGVLAISGGSILLDNAVEAKITEPSTSTCDGILELNAPIIRVGLNTVAIDQFAHVSLTASGGVIAEGKGGISVGMSLWKHRVQNDEAGYNLSELAEIAELKARGFDPDAVAAANNLDLGAPLGAGAEILVPQAAQNLFITTPVLTGRSASDLTLKTSGSVCIYSPDATEMTQQNLPSGLGSKLELSGRDVLIDSKISLSAGSFTARASDGDIVVGGRAGVIDVRGAQLQFGNTIRYTDAGSITLDAAKGNVVLTSFSTLNLDSAVGGGSAGSLQIRVPSGIFQVDPDAHLSASTIKGDSGRLLLDVAAIPEDINGIPSLSSFAAQFSASGFTKSQSYRIRSGDALVDGYFNAHEFTLTVDSGSITVTPEGVIDASGVTGGTIELQASGSIILMPNSALTVRGETYDNAGKGGSIFLSAGACVERVAEGGGTYLDINREAVLDLQTASLIDLGVKATATRSDQFEGTLHLRAPITADGTDIQIGSVDATITGASSIAVEGYSHYDLSDTSGEITTADRTEIITKASTFFGSSGANSETANAILSRLTANQESSIRKIINLCTGVEIINRNGDLTLNSDWDLSGFRTGENQAPGFLTIRSAGDVIFSATLSDGFQSSTSKALLLEYNDRLSPNFQSWSMNLSAGAELNSASLFLASRDGNLSLGKTKDAQRSNLIDPADTTATASGGKSQTEQAIEGFYQVIRTGTGDIRITTGGDLRLMNQFASVYTAGVKSPDQSLGGLLDLPSVAAWDLLYSSDDINQRGLSDFLGYAQSQAAYQAQFTHAGGSIIMDVGRNIARLQSRYDRNHQIDEMLPAYEWDATLTADSSRALPTSWLMRRGSTESDGRWSVSDFTSSGGGKEILSTSWWINYSNYLGGIGALAGGNITVNASGNIANMDFSIPTQFRTSGRSLDGSVILSSQSQGFETGGGDLTLRSGGDLDGGSVYIERGDGNIRVGGNLTSNKTRDAGGDYLYFQQNTTINTKYSNPDPLTWLPTGFFQGKGSVRVVAGGSALVAPMGNVFMQVQGINNPYQYKNFFSTFGGSGVADQGFSVTTLGGDLTYRATILGIPTYQAWSALGSILKPRDHYMAGTYQPWIRISEAKIDLPSSLSAPTGLSAPSLELVSAGGNLSLEGNVTLSPSEDGNLVMLASGSLKGLSKSGWTTPWTTTMVNLSDASPEALPSATRPAAFPTLEPGNFINLNGVADALGETGSYDGINKTLSVQTARHASSILHRNDESPVLVYAGGGDITGLKLFSPKAVEIRASGDISDVSFYIQNIRASDRSVISAGGDIIPYNPLTLSQKRAQSELSVEREKSALLQSGDIQISGPGKLEIFASGNIDLGLAPDRAWKEDPLDRTIWNGITSIGNARNPFLPFAGADIKLTAGYNPKYQDGILSLLTTVDSMVKASWDTIRSKAVTSSDPDVIAAQWGKLSAEEPYKFLVPKEMNDATWEFLVSKDMLWTVLKVADALSQSEYGNLSAKLTSQSVDLWNFVHLTRNSLQAIMDAKLDSYELNKELKMAGFTVDQAKALVKRKAEDPKYQISTDDLWNSIGSKELSGTLRTEIAGFWSEVNNRSDLSVSDKLAISETLFSNLLKKSARNYNNQESPEWKTYELGGRAVVTAYGDAWYGDLVDQLGESGIRSQAINYFKDIGSKDKNTLSALERRMLDYWSKQEIDSTSTQELFFQVLDIAESVGFVGQADHKDDLKISSAANEAIQSIFGDNFIKNKGSVLSRARDIRTQNGGSISIFAPAGGLTLSSIDPNQKDPPFGIVSAYGGSMNIYTRESVGIGIGRIFTLRGGDILIWSDKGDIAAGSSAKTVLSAPPTRVLIDPQSATIQTDLAGLSTGGGIGALAAVKNVPVADIDLIAPSGFIDAGDAGIRSTGKIFLASEDKRGLDNVFGAGGIVGAPPPAAPSAPPPAAPPPAAPPAGSTAAAAAGNSAADNSASRNDRNDQGDQQPSIFSIDILGYGGGDEGEEKKAADATVAPVQASL